MSLQSVTCLLLDCDADPDCDAGNDDGPYHFTTEQQARDWATNNGWTIDGPNTICRTHTARAACAAEGHPWEDWRTVPMDATSTYQVRYCTRWGDAEHNPPLDVIQQVLDAQVAA